MFCEILLKDSGGNVQTFEVVLGVEWVAKEGLWSHSHVPHGETTFKELPSQLSDNFPNSGAKN